ncbi:MAG: ketosteroid isomerase, partial [Gemmatimonadetes bacterium]
LTTEPTKVLVSSAGDVAHMTGSYRFGMDGPKGQRIEDVGKYVMTWTKVNGEWKATLDIFNSDKPAR